MRWTLEAAGLEPDGLLGLARIRVLGLLYLSVLRVWLRDDTPDMASTMKALDGRLSQLEQLANTFERGGRRRRDAPKVVVIGGGTGLSVLLRGLKRHTENITAIVSVSDDGGSSGKLIDEFGVLPPGDFQYPQ